MSDSGQYVCVVTSNGVRVASNIGVLTIYGELCLRCHVMQYSFVVHWCYMIVVILMVMTDSGDYDQ